MSGEKGKMMRRKVTMKSGERERVNKREMRLRKKY